LRSKFDQLGENDQYLKDNGWQDSVKVVFFQAAVPTGWTQDVSANDKFLRVVNNTGGNPGGAVGGSLAVSSGLTLVHDHGTITGVGNHSHSGISSHAHGMTTGVGSNSIGSNFPTAIGNTVNSQFQNTFGSGSTPRWSKNFVTTASDVDATSSAGSHSHASNSALSNVQPAYADVIIGVKSTSSGYTDFTAFFNHNDRIRYEPFGATSGLYGNDVFNQARLTPTGTVSMFYNAAAPTGWSKLATQNDKALRIVSGAGGGTGGSLGTGQTITLQHIHSTAASGSHSHTLGSHRHDVGQVTAGPASFSGVFFYITVDGSDYFKPTNNDGSVQSAVKGRTNKTGGGGASGTDPDHTHTLNSSLTNIVLAYVDMIQCQKLGTGAPYSFQDLTSTIQYKDLVSKQRLNKYAQNDEHIRYHTTPAGSIMAFYQSAIPLLWTLVSAQHDKVLRVVSGAGGGSGGSHLISNAITLAHTHSITSYVHSHTYPSHSHVMDTNSQAAGTPISNRYLTNPSGNEVHVGSDTGVFGSRLKNTTTSVATTTTTDSHNHGGTSSSALSNVTFAYANVILCQKN
jgi:hypothetical protein